MFPSYFPQNEILSLKQSCQLREHVEHIRYLSSLTSYQKARSFRVKSSIFFFLINGQAFFNLIGTLRPHLSDIQDNVHHVLPDVVVIDRCGGKLQ
jgi:hypothetical protein